MKIKDIFKNKRILALAAAAVVTFTSVYPTQVFAETTESTAPSTISEYSSSTTTEAVSNVVITAKNVDESARIANAIICVSDASKKLGFEKISDGVYSYPGNEKALVSDEYGDVTIKGLPTGTYSVTDAGTEDKYMFSHADMFTIETDSTSIATTAEYKNNSGILELTFIDGDDKSTIAKGRFVIKNSAGTELDITYVNGVYEYSTSKSGAAEFITNSSGKATLTKLPAGTYTIEEVYAPSKYNSGYVSQEFSITAQQTTSVTISNTQNYGDLSFNLTSNATSEKISGAVFQVVNSDGYALPMYESSDNVFYYDRTGTVTDIGIKSTTSNVVVIGLPAGSYTIHNKTAATNHSKAGDTTFSITKGQQTSLSLVAKTATGSLSIIKKDETTGDPLKGFKLSILTTDKTPMNFVLKDGVYTFVSEKTDDSTTELVTDENGKVLAQGIPVGKVLIQEIASTEGYVFNREPVEKEIAADVETEVSSTASKSNCAVTLVDEEGKALAGVGVTVKDKDGKEVISSDSNDNGKILMSNIAEGDYTYTIVSVPDGYAMPTQATFSFKVDDKGNATGLENVTIENRKVYAKVNISEDMDINEIEFTLISKDGKKTTAKPDKDGIAIFDKVLNGDYTLELTKFPTGYEAKDTSYDVKVAENGMNSEKSYEFKLTLAETTAPVEKKSTPVALIVILVIILLACIGGIAFLVIKNKKSNPSTGNDNDTTEEDDDDDDESPVVISVDDTEEEIEDEPETTTPVDEPVVIEEPKESPTVETNVEDRKPAKQSQPLDPFQELDADEATISENVKKIMAEDDK